LSRNTANEVIVWVKKSPEYFVSRPVQTEPLDGVRVVVRQGLKPGERIVVQGASLISQIR
jgi:multidrug efflux pump subunit AcrA (membrane-fusion protein)